MIVVGLSESLVWTTQQNTGSHMETHEYQIQDSGP